MDDIGSVDEIKKWAKEYDAEVIDDLYLKTQFRCSGSDAYLKWLDHTLMIPTDSPKPTKGLGYKVSVVDTIPELMTEIKKRREDGRTARYMAGYCWDWSSNPSNRKDKSQALPETDICLDGVSLRWNSKTDTWANNEKYKDEVGCIHSAQGMEFQVCGVIIGDDLKYRDGKVITDPEARSDKSGTLKGYKQNPEWAD